VADAQEYDIVRMAAALRRRLWIVLAVPIAIAAVLILRNLTAEYQVDFRASILLPGDTEIPGRSERPELMILDDFQSVVTSRAFAEIVATHAQLPVDDVEDAFDTSRLGRVVTITVSDSDAERVEVVAQAAASVLPQAVNRFMVAEGGAEATVIVIDPPGDARRGDPDQWTIAMIATVVGLVIGCFAALALDATAATFGSRKSP
jgi:capsular polysaccharide biosynthesis protein